jgi:hypothetical protein
VINQLVVTPPVLNTPRRKNMSGIEIVFCLLLFIILAPLAASVGIVLCSRVFYAVFNRFYKEKVIKTGTKIMDDITDRLRKDEESKKKETVDSFVNTINKASGLNFKVKEE